MTIHDWYVIRDNRTQKTHLVYGSIQEYIEDEPALENNYHEIPFEDWSTEYLIEIIEDFYEDCNRHSMCGEARRLQEILTAVSIEPEKQQQFFQQYVKNLSDRLNPPTDSLRQKEPIEEKITCHCDECVHSKTVKDSAYKDELKDSGLTEDDLVCTLYITDNDLPLHVAANGYCQSGMRTE